MEILHIKHPTYESANEFQIAVFKVGYYEDIPQNVTDAWKRLCFTLDERAEELALIREWGGNVNRSAPQRRRLVNPPITSEMQEEFINSVRASYPDCRITDSWKNAQNGVVGFSVKFR
jgi:hypothetical protein